MISMRQFPEIEPDALYATPEGKELYWALIPRIIVRLHDLDADRARAIREIQKLVPSIRESMARIRELRNQGFGRSPMDDEPTLEDATNRELRTMLERSRIRHEMTSAAKPRIIPTEES